MSWVQKIPWSEFSFEVSRSSGPGGQNVNKTNSAVLLRWSLVETLALTSEQKDKLLRRLASKLTTLGELLIRSQESRDQDQNKKECLRKFDEIIARALFEPKARKATKPTRGSQRRRIEGKKQRSDIKQGRQKVRD